MGAGFAGLGKCCDWWIDPSLSFSRAVAALFLKDLSTGVRMLTALVSDKYFLAIAEVA